MASTKIFQYMTPPSGATIYGHELKTNGTGIEPGKVVILDAGGATVSLAAASGSKPFGFAYGTRDLNYAPTTRVYDTAEPVSVLTGRGFALFSADFFASGSLPTESANQAPIYAGASGTITVTPGGTQIGRIVDVKTAYDASGGTGTAVEVALIEFDFDL